MSQISRRAFLQMCLPLVLAACSAPAAAPTAPSAPAPTRPAEPTPTPSQPAASAATSPALAPTPACGDDDEPTPPQTEGPYFTPNSPERASLLEAGVTGARLVITGYVLTTNCQPVDGALLDFWQADDAGQYDNVGYRLRGHQFTDAQGRYSLETVVPGLYPGRTRHIHVKVQAPGQPVLTTQLYFPNEAANAADRFFDSALVVAEQPAAAGRAASFDFVLAVP